jgi:hypothetical protein
MNAIDRDALERALVACRAESAARAKQIDSKLYGKHPKPWESVAEFAAYCVQSRSLDLMPWQRAPLFYANQLDIALREPFGDTRGTREAAELLKKLLTLGLSRFEPFPLQAIERVEAEAKRRPAK